MTAEMIALARRAVACKGFRWMPGMLHGTPTREGIAWTTRYSDLGLHVDEDRVPVLSDPATLGCLLALVREAWGDEYASVWYDSEYWQSGNRWSWHAKEQSLVDYDTEAEALVAALEAAPA